MALKSQVVAVTTTAAQLSLPDSDKRPGMTVAIAVPTGGVTVYVGGPDVSTANGWPIAAGTAFSLDLNTPGPGYSDSADAVWLVSGGTQNVNVLAAGV